MTRKQLDVEQSKDKFDRYKREGSENYSLPFLFKKINPFLEQSQK